jgi:hypothetical protein
LPDGDPKRDRLLDYVSEVEDWFQSIFFRAVRRFGS